ncbi:hypothetical protein VP1G_09024 [Cytospora mali]|uniref:RING-type domain-containing protein n=1 Tax=Cytospora mali TaxID=578113 RepID=A0A194VDC3_CYTMA|nr:hypothetical protein VP1G_09024 [Valsa mali var. pyri (nom. inval.)]
MRSSHRSQEEHRSKDWQRQYAGTVAQFADGAHVDNISLPSDFSVVCLSMLPVGSSPSTIAADLVKFGFAVTPGSVRILPQREAIGLSAIVRVQDLSFAKRLCGSYASSSNTATKDAASRIKAVPINAPTPHGGSFRSVDCKKVNCSWHRPCRTVWLSFGNREVAQRVCDKFNSGVYRVLDQQVTSSTPKGSPSSGSPRSRNPQAWTLMLTDVPAIASKAEIMQHIPAAIQPRHQKVNEAQRLLAELIRSGARAETAIELNKEQFKWACQGGFMLISSTVGDGAVTFDVVSNPKRIKVTGSEDQYQTAMKMVAEKAQPQRRVIEDSDEKYCVICWTEAEQPVRTSCNHTYCTDCFQDFYFSGSTGGSDLCVRCEGDLSKCMSVLPLTELQEKLPSSVFEDLLEASFKSYIRHRPQEFGYCPTPDCIQVYRIGSTSNPSTFTCTKCLVATCTRCQTSHPGMTCVDHKEIASGRYDAIKAAKAALGIKDCSNCKTPIEKTLACMMKTMGMNQVRTRTGSVTAGPG